MEFVYELRHRQALYDRQSTDEVRDATIDFIFDEIDEALLHADFGWVDQVLRAVAPAELDLQFRLAFFTIAAGAASKLAAYADFWQRCYAATSATDPALAERLFARYKPADMPQQGNTETS